MTGRKIKLSLLAKPKSTLFYENLNFHNLTTSKLLILLVGTAGFEPATPCPPDKCATRLRHAPTVTKSLHYRLLTLFR
jgi:hypothetical protein